MLDRVDGSVDRAAFRAEVLLERCFAVFGDMKRVGDELVDTLVLRSGDRNDRNAQNVLHQVDVDRAAVAGKFVHHVEGDNDRAAGLKELHRQI